MLRFFLFIIIFMFSGNATARSLELLYVNANTGAAAGGHIGLKLGSEVFHYQFYPDRRFLLVREPWESFKHVYNRLRNRTIRAAVVPVSEGTYYQVRSHFNTLLALQRQRTSVYRQLLKEKGLLSSARSPVFTFPLRGLGFFSGQSPSSEASIYLAQYLALQLGDLYLDEAHDSLGEQISGMVKIRGEDRGSPHRLRTILRETAHQLEKAGALEQIISRHPLKEETLSRALPGPLSLRARNNLRKHLLRRCEVLRGLLISKREDTGASIAIETARCLAILQSLAQNRLITLDPYPDDARTKRLEPDDAELEMYLKGLRKRLKQQTVDLLEAELDDQGMALDYHYLQLENTHGRFSEVEQAGNTKSEIRVTSDLMLVSRSSSATLNIPKVREEALSGALKNVEEELERAKEHDSARYGYQLIERNCVNLLLAELNKSLGERDEVRSRLGDYIDPVSDRIVIPHDFYYQVTQRYRVKQIISYPSRRLEALELMKYKHGSVPLWLQEGNTRTSTLYTRRPEDTPFLFFTDDIVWARPLLGIGNIAWASAHALGGLMYMGAQKETTVKQSVQGIVYSLPELIFFNIRKGTYLYDNIHEGGHEL